MSRELEPQVEAAIDKDTADTLNMPLDRTVLDLYAATRTADNLTRIEKSTHRIAEALEGLLLVLDTRGEVSDYLTRKP